MSSKNTGIMWKTFLVIAFFCAAGNANDCVPRRFGFDGIVCVCNATYCDGLSKNQPEVPDEGNAFMYVSNKNGLRLQESLVQFNTCHISLFESTLTVDTTKRYQTIAGFGGALTDSAGLNIKKLSSAAQDQLLRSYYDPKTGSGYNLARLPIGGSDFSTRPYTYDPYDNDTTLEHFNLAFEDHEYKIPFLQKALKLNPNLKLFGAVWSPPPWMKTNNKVNGAGFLKKEYYQLYAEYILKFLKKYKEFGIDIAAVSTGNEPGNGVVIVDPLSSMGWTPNTVAKWIANNLGPTLAASEHNRTQILVLDDQRIFLPWYVEEIAKNEEAMKYVAGIASHWYTDFIVPTSVLDQTHDKFPDKFLIMTEACLGTGEPLTPVVLGSWYRGEKYFLSILEYMNHWYAGWVDWNMVLDKTGGPNWIKNNVDAPIIVNPESDEFFKQPMYYALKHFSRFVGRGSVKVSVTDTLHIKSTAFVTPSNKVVVVLYNRGLSPKQVVLKDAKKSSLCLELSPQSMNTIKY
ncbi:lysosomal acid glucosylceramidase-like [Colletes gigas]|uniref:lysosomal acid glucosylceramidase-like n=1 Tax=Colletes gigas TaxID=935657 RepID=UPI001C9B0AC6|nr:lysosomal acid glucosylceramidase-like [Colletes gigas]